MNTTATDPQANTFHLRPIDLFGHKIEHPGRAALRGGWYVPPLDALDARPAGFHGWGTRRAAWSSLGLEPPVVAPPRKRRPPMFCPALAELVVRWFCPPGGQVVDPFAGDAVRGVVSGMLGRPYHGIELRGDQAHANRLAWRAIGEERALVTVDVAALRSACYPDTPGHLRVGEPGDDAAGYVLPLTIDGGRLTTAQAFRPLFGPPAGPGTVPLYTFFRPLVDAIVGDADGLLLRSHLAGEAAADVVADVPLSSCHDLRPDLYPLPAGRALTVDGSDLRADRVAWVVADALDVAADLPAADLLFVSPPHGAADRYSDDDRDLSTMPHDQFLRAYARVVADAVGRLRDDRFACVVVSDYRDAKGFLRGFPSATHAAFCEAGLRPYNEVSVVDLSASAPLSARESFAGNRRTIKAHQTLMVFVKGDAKRAAEACGPLCPLIDLSGVRK